MSLTKTTERILHRGKMTSAAVAPTNLPKQPKKTLYHAYFCGDNLGEADGFFEIKDGKLELVDCWSLNDAHWRGEYMTGILTWAGVDLQDLPKKYMAEGEKILEKTWGLDYGDSEEED